MLSLSPGPAQITHAAEIARYAQMWRISNDIWDGWNFVHSKPTDDFPNGIVTAFDNLARWSGYVRRGSCNLTQLEAATRALITNGAIIDLNQGEWTGRPAGALPAGLENIRAWLASGRKSGQRAAAVHVETFRLQPARPSQVANTAVQCSAGVFG